MSLRMPEHLWLCAHCRRGLDSGDNPARWVRRTASSGGLLLLQMAGLVVLTTAVAARACEFAVEWLRRCPRRVLSMREACQQIQRCVACAARISLLPKAAAWRVTYNRRPQHQEWHSRCKVVVKLSRSALYSSLYRKALGRALNRRIHTILRTLLVPARLRRIQRIQLYSVYTIQRIQYTTLYTLPLLTTAFARVGCR